MSADTKAIFQGKVAIVTGAGSGIGRAIALLLAARGAAVSIVDLSPEGSVTLAEIHDAGGKALFLKGNVTDSEFVA
ncbi:MAG: SDR family NAD(P)-dependent oxidoreductase, partial [Actinobacteria bacterium]|nr:SDR family NAD(P)-dependent oxidoreductase [Actinomycetota bacterium]